MTTPAGVGGMTGDERQRFDKVGTWPLRSCFLWAVKSAQFKVQTHSCMVKVTRDTKEVQNQKGLSLGSADMLWKFPLIKYSYTEGDFALPPKSNFARVVPEQATRPHIHNLAIIRVHT